MGVWIAEVEQGRSRADEAPPNSAGCPLEELALLDWIGNDLPIALAVANRCAARDAKDPLTARPLLSSFPTLPSDSFPQLHSRTLFPPLPPRPPRCTVPVLFSSEGSPRLARFDFTRTCFTEILLHHHLTQRPEVSECRYAKIIGKASPTTH